MDIAWLDVTMPFDPEMTVWPGDPAFDFTALRRIAQGDACNTSRVALCTHTGTHIDAPWHFEEEGARVDELDPALFFGRAEVREVECGEAIAPADLGEGLLPPRLLIKTRNSGFSDRGAFREDYAALSEQAAWRLVDEGVVLVGVDYLSVAPFKQDGQQTHHVLLSRGVLAVEGLRLAGVPAGPCEFVVLPMQIAGADGAPCRAFVGLGA